MKVLWVDDEPGNVWTAIARLRRRGNCVQVVTAAEEAIAYLHAYPEEFDVVVLDLWLRRRELHDEEDPQEEEVEAPLLPLPEGSLPPHLKIGSRILPEHVGAECVRIIREELGAPLPMMVYTCRADAMEESVLQELSELDVHCVLSKTPDDTELIAAIDEAAASSASS